MVKTCVAAGCNNSNQDGVSLHKFPSHCALRKKWVDQVKRHRDKWELTAYSVLCSEHFEPLCFMADSILSQSLGLGKKRACLMQYPHCSASLCVEKGKQKGKFCHQGSGMLLKSVNGVD